METQEVDYQHGVPGLWDESRLLEFDIGFNEIRDGAVSFEADSVSFRFTPRPQTGRMECTVEILDRTGTKATTVIQPDQTSPTWLCFSGFGWHDTRMIHPITICRYRVTLNGPDTVRVAVNGVEM